MFLALSVLAAISLIVFLIHLVMGKEMNIVKSIEIEKPISEVFSYLKQTKNQDYFSVWNMADPSMKKEYIGSDGEVGFVYKWESENKNVGAGEQEIKQITENKTIQYEVRFSKPMKNTGCPKFELESVAQNKTLVSWIFICPAKFPMTLMKSMFEKMLGKDLALSLENLKAVLEK